jgi:small subunit ribosomal protein S4e
LEHRIRYPDPAIKVNDTVKIDLSTGKISEFIRFDTAVIAMATGGRNMGRVGVITHRERHDGGFNIVHIKDAMDNSFATRENNVFVIGNEKPWISLPKGKGVKVRDGSMPREKTPVILILYSFQLQKREIVVGHMQLQDIEGMRLISGVIWYGTLESSC